MQIARREASMAEGIMGMLRIQAAPASKLIHGRLIELGLHRMINSADSFKPRSIERSQSSPAAILSPSDDTNALMSRRKSRESAVFRRVAIVVSSLT